MDHNPSIIDKIQIECEPTHEEGHKVNGANYVYSYTIRITNYSNNAVKLIRRHWLITDGPNSERDVKGKGVVGLEPEIGPGESFQYQSWCPLTSEIGLMTGEYTFLNLDSNKEFEVPIPSFILQPNYSLN